MILEEFQFPQECAYAFMFVRRHERQKKTDGKKNGWKKLDEKINRMKKEMVSNLSQTSRLSTSPLFLGVPVPGNVVYPSRLESLLRL
jgi:hypothetical protein